MAARTSGARRVMVEKRMVDGGWGGRWLSGEGSEELSEWSS